MKLSIKPQKSPQLQIEKLPTAMIYPNPNQPRRYFDPEGLRELSESIREHGVLQPLSVRRIGKQYELVAGERRLRASKLAGLHEVPCIIISVSDEESSLLALIENLQRRDLDCFETAQGYIRLMDMYSMTQSEAARRLGKSQASIANKIRLLKLSEQETEFVRMSGLTERHARAVLRIEGDKMDALRHIAAEDMTVREAEIYVDSLQSPPEPQPTVKKAPTRKRSLPAPMIRDMKIFINSISRAVDVMKASGISAEMKKEESDTAMTINITIPYRK